MAVGWVGNQTLGSTAVQMPPANFKAASRFQNTSGVDLTITDLYGVWLAAGSFTSLHLKGVVYSDVASLPSALLHTTNEITTIVAGAQVMPFASSWVWTAGTILWLGIIADTTLVTQSLNPAATGGIKFNADTYSDGPSDPFGGSPSSTDLLYVIWAEGYDGAQRLGRISIDGDPIGQYYKLDPHYERFQLGVAAAPMGAAATVAIRQISVYVTSTVTVHSRCALYADDGGVSGKPNGATLLGTTNELTGFVANTWHTYTFAVPLVVAAGQYWLAVVTDDGGGLTNVTNYNGQLSSAGGAQTDPDFYTFDNPVSTVAPLLSDQRPRGISIYADYSLSPTLDQIVFPQLPPQPRRPIRVVAY